MKIEGTTNNQGFGGVQGPNPSKLLQEMQDYLSNPTQDGLKQVAANGQSLFPASSYPTLNAGFASLMNMVGLNQDTPVPKELIKVLQNAINAGQIHDWDPKKIEDGFYQKFLDLCLPPSEPSSKDLLILSDNLAPSIGKGFNKFFPNGETDDYTTSRSEYMNYLEHQQ
ncbi:MAG: hypothetical protein SP1CHLAM54_03010 [Chlamydiia bacterium]|nr:hypothetical protein [Chlamydiia bacterium]MCH9615217.1 hypothetical protein [Chlamydiia bacterium]MCH9628461.1 hypothetical protein [Chlamydiia bacterium]